MNKLSKYVPSRLRREKEDISPQGPPHNPEKYVGPYDDSPIPRVTIHSFIMGVFVSMGGFIFGYDTGQISGFLGMADFLQRFGQKNADGSGYHFSNVRSGLIVALVSCRKPVHD
jgi:SP family sugar:H+ symporter-like MFS transporter